MSDCPVRSRPREVYGEVEAPLFAKTPLRVHNSLEICLDTHLGLPRLPIAQTRAAMYRARWEDVSQVDPRFTLATQLMTLSVPCNVATLVYRVGPLSDHGSKWQNWRFLNWCRCHCEDLYKLLYCFTLVISIAKLWLYLVTHNGYSCRVTADSEFA